MARPSQLRTRLHAVLSAERARGPVPAYVAAPALIGAGVLLAVIAALTPARAGAAEPLDRLPRHRASFPRAAATSTKRRTTRACAPLGWSTGTCSGSARIQGDVRFADDFTAVRSVAPGGTFQHRAARRRTRRRRSSSAPARAAASIGRSASAGASVAWGPEAERWLAAALPS